MLRPFVPAQDYERSIQFYEALGFEAKSANDRITLMSDGTDSFLLQNFYVEELAHNLMIQLSISNVAAWWSQHDPERIGARFGTKPPSPPTLQPWGLMVGFIHDPSGVLWHITEAAP